MPCGRESAFIITRGGREVAMKSAYYCPRGCNVFETEIEDPECFACGRIMLTNSERFEEAHERRDLAAMEERERKLKEGKEPV